MSGQSAKAGFGKVKRETKEIRILRTPKFYWAGQEINVKLT